jgi:hypothetical protein
MADDVVLNKLVTVERRVALVRTFMSSTFLLNK